MLTDLQQYLGRLGSGITSSPRPRNYSGALLNKRFGGVQVINRFTTQVIEYGTEVEDIGGWFDPITPTRLTVPQGVSRVRLMHTIMHAPSASPAQTDQSFMNFLLNGSGFGGFGRLNVRLTEQNFWNVATNPIPVVPGDFFETSLNLFSSIAVANTVVQATSDTSFGIEAVTC